MKGKRKKSLNLGLGNYLCNNNCIFCVDGEKENLPLPSVKQIFGILRQWRRKTDSVLLCGPEPTLNPYLPDVIKKAKELGYTEIRLITNGRRLFYFDFAKKIIESGVTELCVSFHGSNSRIQDAQTRTSGSFNQTFTACQNLSKLKSIYKFKWYINYTFNKLNISNFYKFFKMAISFNGLNGLNISAIMPKGRALNYFEIVVPSYTELAKTFKKVIKQYEETPFFKKRLGRGFDLSITGLPPCLMKGYENHVGAYNDLYLLKDPRDKGLKIFRKELEQERIKRPQCESCCYYKTCSGVWEEYIKRKGWKEFQPVIL